MRIKQYLYRHPIAFILAIVVGIVLFILAGIVGHALQYRLGQWASELLGR